MKITISGDYKYFINLENDLKRGSSEFDNIVSSIIKSKIINKYNNKDIIYNLKIFDNKFLNLNIESK